MSSDTFDVRVKSVQGTEVVLDVLTNTGGGYDDLCASRSFALLVLHDALRRAKDAHIHAMKDPARRAEMVRLDEKHGKAVLVRELAEEADDWQLDEAWMRENVARFVKEVDVVERRNAVGEAELARREKELADEYANTPERGDEWQAKRWERCHNYTLRVVVTDAKYAEHLEPGLAFGTTAFDVWYER